MKKYSIFLVFVTLLFFLSGSAQQKRTPKAQPKKIPRAQPTNNPKDCEEARWTGTLTLEENYTGITGTSERHVTVSFTDALPTRFSHVENTGLPFTGDKGRGNATFHADATYGTKKIGITDCVGSGQAELSDVVINHGENTYTIEARGPACNGSTISLIGGPTELYGPEITGILVLDHQLTDDSFLGGTKTEVGETGVGLGTLTKTTTWSLKRTCPPWKDPYTEKRTNKLNAKVKDPVSRFIKRVNAELCIKLRVAEGFRTIAEQDDLYAKGRTKPGKIVTNAKGGESNHNSGLAIDVYIVNCDGTIDLDTVIPPKVVTIAKQEGLEWGGDWKKFKDYPHFEKKF
jgi:D-alanyl-D-alanine carboxypeptidase